MEKIIHPLLRARRSEVLGVPPPGPSAVAPGPRGVAWSRPGDGGRPDLLNITLIMLSCNTGVNPYTSRGRAGRVGRAAISRCASLGGKVAGRIGFACFASASLRNSLITH